MRLSQIQGNYIFKTAGFILFRSHANGFTAFIKVHGGIIDVFSSNGQLIYRGTKASIEGLNHGIYIVRNSGRATKVLL